MAFPLAKAVSAGWLCRQLGLELLGADSEIRELSSLDALAGHGLSFVMEGHNVEPHARGTVFADASLAGNGVSVIRSSKPRLDFIRSQHLLARDPGFQEADAPAQLHPSVRVGRFTVIENGVSVGEGTRIGHHVVIRSGTRIGRECEIKSGAIIGDPGYGFERDGDNRPLKMLHLGGVRIGDRVEVGSLTTVCRGALGDTVLEDYVKLDDHVHIAHNCFIGEGTMITACAEISGSVRVGRNCWLAPNCSLVQKIAVGDDSFIGIGAVVTKPVAARTKVFGNPAKPLPPKLGSSA